MTKQDLFSGIQGWLDISKSIMIFYDIHNKGEKSISISLDSERTPDKSSSCSYKVLIKMKIGKKYLHRPYRDFTNIKKQSPECLGGSVG